MTQTEILEQILSKKAELSRPDENIRSLIKKNWDSIAKPLDSMGKFEGEISKIGAIGETSKPDLERSALLVFCADNGIVAQGISQSGQEITTICAKNIAKGMSSVGAMAKYIGVDLLTVDVGVNTDDNLSDAGIVDRKVMRGTHDFSAEPAMSNEQMMEAILVGFDMVKKCGEDGYKLIGLGEMGIGNTTTSSAVTAALLRLPAKCVTGKGAGLSAEKVEHKACVIQQAIHKYDLYAKEPLEILRTVGGLDIAAMVGTLLGGAYYKIPIVLDGFISMAAALVASRISKVAGDYWIASHYSKEPAVDNLCQELNLNPVIHADMALGEGSGAVMLIGLLKMAAKVYENGCTFENAGIEQYERNGQQA